MDIVFCGTPAFAVATLRALLDDAAGDFNVRLVVCQPDRPSGRGLQVTTPPTKQLALERGVPVLQPDKIKNNSEFRQQLEAIRPQAIVVVAYGRIIPPWMLELPPLGNINLHASLLPKYRGAAPIQWAIAEGETTTGNTTMRLDAGLDTGDILLTNELAIEPEDTAETLLRRLASAGAPLMLATLRGLESGSIAPRPQDHRQATLAPPLKKEDGLIDFRRPAVAISNRLRGFTPWPGAYTTFRGHSLNLWKLRPFAPAKPALSGDQGHSSAAAEPLTPGQLHVQGTQLYVACGQNTALEILELQPQGKRRLAAHDFINGYRPSKGEMLG